MLFLNSMTLSTHPCLPTGFNAVSPGTAPLFRGETKIEIPGHRYKEIPIMNNTGERRKHKRAGEPFVMNVRIRPDEAQKAVSYGWDKVSVRSLGAGGLCFYYNKNLEMDSPVDFKIYISRDAPLVNCSGKVTRIKKHLQSSIFDIAVEFTEISEKEIETINKAVGENLG